MTSPSASEEENVPGLGRRSFQSTADELTTCLTEHTFLLTVIGSRAELTRCRTETNFTLRDAVITGGPNAFNRINWLFTGLNNYGLNDCDCDFSLSSLQNVNFIGTFNGQAIARFPELRSGSQCGTGYNYQASINGSNWSGFFDTQWRWPPLGIRPTVQKYVDPIPTNAVILFAQSQLNPWFVEPIPVVEECYGTWRIKNPNKLNSSSEFTIYPNPSENFLYISDIKIGSEVSIEDILGRKVSQFIILNDPFRINISAFRTGLYLIRSNDYFKKFIKN